MTIPLSPIALAAAAAAGSGSGSASTLVTAAREMAGVLGIAVTGAVIAARSDVLVAAGASARTGFLDGYRLGLLTAAALTLAGALIAGVLLRDRDRSAS